MTCPYVVNRKVASQTTFEYDEEGTQTAQQILESNIAQFAECTKEGCGAWWDGRCAYRGAE